MITCLVTNWGLTFILGLLLVTSEYLSRTKRFKENGVLDALVAVLKVILQKGDQK